MRLKVMLTAAVVLTAAMTFPTVASGATSDSALWSTSSTGNASSVADCGSGGAARSVDDNHFCVIDDPGAVELGVKFTSAQPVLVTGVRVYRADGGTVTGSLWSAAGTRLATGTFAPQAGDGWQDLHFATPVRIEAQQTYVASYSAPTATYAFEWGYFAARSVTNGPITALQSTASDLNGVYCYVNEPCNGFPSQSYNDTNYWVSPLWDPYAFTGFSQPVDVDKVNVAKAGSAIPVKFGLGGDFGLAIFQDGYPKVKPVSCDPAAAADAIETTVTSAGASTLTYDATAGQYVYVWKTSKAWANTCYRFDLGLNDGSDHTFGVKFTR